MTDTEEHTLIAVHRRINGSYSEDGMDEVLNRVLGPLFEDLGRQRSKIFKAIFEHEFQLQYDAGIQISVNDWRRPLIHVLLDLVYVVQSHKHRQVVRLLASMFDEDDAWWLMRRIHEADLHFSIAIETIEDAGRQADGKLPKIRRVVLGEEAA